MARERPATEAVELDRQCDKVMRCGPIGLNRRAETHMRMLRSTFAGLIVAIALGAATADAQTVRWKEYLNPGKPAYKEFTQLYLAGVRDGLIAYSVAARGTLFCLPPKTALTAEQLDGMMRRWAGKQTASLDSTPIVVILLAALKDGFPCQ